VSWSVVEGQQASGTHTGTGSSSATLPAGTTAGNTVFIIFGHGSTTFTAPAGFTPDKASAGGSAQLRVYRKTAVDAESSWSFSNATTSTAVQWWAFEVEGLDNSAPIDAVPSNIATGTGTAAETVTTGTNAMSTVYDGMVLAVYVGWATSSTSSTWSGYGQGLVEQFDGGVANGATAVSLAVALRSTQTPTTWDIPATQSVSQVWSATHIVYAAAGAKRAPLVDVMFGGGLGTTAGLATGPAGAAIFDAVTGSPAVSGGWLELSSSAAAENASWSGSGALGMYQPSLSADLVARFTVLFPGSLPSVDTQIFAATLMSIRFDAATGKLAATAGTGTAVLSAGTVVADTEYFVDVRAHRSTSAATIDWQIDGVEQTQATGTTTTNVHTEAVLGWTTAITASVKLKNIVLSKIIGQYPLGNIVCHMLTVDSAGTVTVSGSTANFGVMTANGTVAAWNAAAALAAVDDLPPTIGASADGVVAVTAHATDYVQFPMQTRDAAANGESIRAVRWYFPLWAAATTVATIRLSAWDGTVDTNLYSEADPNADNSTTTPVWVCRMHRALAQSTPYLWTQAKLDALAARMGSNDATPDIGVHAVYAELAVRPGETRQLFGDLASQTLDPDSAGVVQISVDAPTGNATDLYYEENASPTTVPVTGGTSHTETIGAPDMPTINYIALYPPAEPDPEA
jgi:enamine deaminase RidA (YjgF/YER057c/UK114 family)